MKAAGAVLVLGAAFLYGYQGKLRLEEHVRQLLQWKEILMMLSSEMTYTKTPLAEAFSNLAKGGKPPFGEFFESLSRRLDRERDKTFFELWQSQIADSGSAFCFTKDEMEIFTGLGEHLGHSDLQFQTDRMQLYVQQVEQKVVQAQGELAEKQRLYQYLSVMCGLFIILLFL